MYIIYIFVLLSIGTLVGFTAFSKSSPHSSLVRLFTATSYRTASEQDIQNQSFDQCLFFLFWILSCGFGYWNSFLEVQFQVYVFCVMEKTTHKVFGVQLDCQSYIICLWQNWCYLAPAPKEEPISKQIPFTFEHSRWHCKTKINGW